jgi:hypothetical protein
LVEQGGYEEAEEVVFKEEKVVTRRLEKDHLV